MGLVARALESLGGRAGVSAGAVAERLSDLTYQGLAKPLRFTTGRIDTLRGEGYFLYQTAGNVFRFLGRYDRFTKHG